MRIVGILIFLAVVWMVADVAPLPAPQPSAAEIACRETLPEVQRCGLPPGWVPDALEAMLDRHAIWRESGGTAGERAKLCHADLSGVDLSGVSLAGADLQGARLIGAELSNADLTDAMMAGAELRGAVLRSVSLRGADLRGAELGGSDLTGADISSAMLSHARLDGVLAIDASFSKARMDRASAVGIRATNSAWESACLLGTKLTGAQLQGSNLAKALLIETTLDRADLSGADLSEALVSGSRLTDAYLTNADLSHARWEATGRPRIGGMTGLIGLETTTYRPGEGDGLSLLRESLSDAGLQELAREAGHARHANRTRHLLAGDLEDKTIGVARIVLFDLTVRYGLEPARALMILTSAIPMFALLFSLAIHARPTCLGIPGAVLAVYPPGTVSLDDGVQPRPAAEGKSAVIARRWLDAYAVGLYVAVLYALRMGLRADQPSPARLLSALQAEPFEIRAIGWTRCVAGVQSLLGLYLLGLWLLSIVAAPFA